MKKLFTLLIVLVGCVAVNAEEVTIYFQPNSNWTQSNAWFAIYLEDNASPSHNQWQKFTPVDGHDGYYQVTVNNSTWTKFVLVRLNPDSEAMSWDNKWNQCPTEDNRISIQSRNACYGIKGESWDSNEYNNSLVPWAYYFVSDKSGTWQVEGEMGVSAPYTYTFDGSSYASKCFAVAPGSGLWATGTIQNWSTVLRPTTDTDANVTVDFNSAFANYSITPVTGSNGSVWYINSENSLKMVTVSYTGSTMSITPYKTASLNANGYGTFGSANDICVPAKDADGNDVKVYYAQSANASGVKMSKLDAETDVNSADGLFLIGEKNKTVKFTPASTTPSAISGNMLKPGDGTAKISSDGNNYYVFSGDAFKKLTTSVVVPVGKAYLYSTTAFARELTISFEDDETTSIRVIDTTNEAADNSAVYNVAGQRVANPTKGLYIVNGKKVLVK